MLFAESDVVDANDVFKPCRAQVANSSLHWTKVMRIYNF